MSNRNPAKLRRSASAICQTAASSVAGVTIAGTMILFGHAQATVVKDFYSNSALWNGFSGQIENLFDGTQAAIGSTFIGNGERLEKVGFVFSFNYGNNNPNNFPDAGEFKLRFSFYSSTATFIASPMQGNVFQIYNLPSNPDWQTQVGNGGGNNLYYIEVDVSALNIITTPGQLHLVSLVPDGQWGSPGILSSGQFALSGGVGESADWYYNHSGSGTFGPASLPNLGAPHANVASRITTVPVCSSDINHDGTVNVNDLLSVINHWGPCPPPCPSDINANGVVSVEDLLAVINHWGTCP